MSFVKCIDVVSMIIGEATARFAPLWKLDVESNRILEQYCSVIDSLAEEFGGEALEVSVDEISMDITITMECEDMIIDSTAHKFCTLTSQAKAISFSASKSGGLNVNFLFPGVWVRT